MQAISRAHPHGNSDQRHRQTRSPVDEAIASMSSSSVKSWFLVGVKVPFCDGSALSKTAQPRPATLDEAQTLELNEFRASTYMPRPRSSNETCCQSEWRWLYDASRVERYYQSLELVQGRPSECCGAPPACDVVCQPLTVPVTVPRLEKQPGSRKASLCLHQTHMVVDYKLEFRGNDVMSLLGADANVCRCTWAWHQLTTEMPPQWEKMTTFLFGDHRASADLTQDFGQQMKSTC